MATSCPLCQHRKGRRACPALGRDICPVCCGTKRLVEITCPDDCRYLTSARVHPPAIVQRQQERDVHFMATLAAGLSELQLRIWISLLAVIAGHAKTAVPRLIDADVAEATEALAGTHETAARGLIYEQQPTSLVAQRLASELRAWLTQLQQEAKRPLDRDAAEALRCIERGARTAARSLDGGETAYMEFVRRRASDVGGAPAADSQQQPKAPDEPRIILS